LQEVFDGLLAARAPSADVSPLRGKPLTVSEQAELVKSAFHEFERSLAEYDSKLQACKVQVEEFQKQSAVLSAAEGNVQVPV